MIPSDGHIFHQEPASEAAASFPAGPPATAEGGYPKAIRVPSDEDRHTISDD